MPAGYTDLLARELAEVQQNIDRAMKVRAGRLVQFAHLELHDTHKYLVPSLALLVARLFDYHDRKAAGLATVLQFVFLADRVHIRVTDHDYDPKDPALDVRDGAPLPVLVGDLLYGKFFTTLCSYDLHDYLDPVARIIAEMNLGAMHRREKWELDPVAETAVTREKPVVEEETGSIFAHTCRLSAHLAGAPAQAQEDMETFGRALGIGYGLLERGGGFKEAAPHFTGALTALARYSGSPSWSYLEEMVRGLAEGTYPVPERIIGDSIQTFHGEIHELHVPAKYKNKEEYVHKIFSSIAKRYDRMNTGLTFNRDKYWRRFAVEKAALKPGGLGLDVACGTGMLTIQQARVTGPEGKVVGVDFCENMLQEARNNIGKTPYKEWIELKQGNAIDLTFEDNTFDCATIGFALRNVPDIRKTIEEMMRVVKPGGKVVSLELSKPGNPVFKQLYYFYFNKLVPLMGKMGVGIEGPYTYLPNSLKVFPHQEEIRNLFAEIGLENAEYFELTGGIVTVHVGTKPLSNK